MFQICMRSPVGGSVWLTWAERDLGVSAKLSWSQGTELGRETEMVWP